MSFFIKHLLLIPLFHAISNAATFFIRNNCPYTVWAAAIPGGGSSSTAANPEPSK
ncbi:putative thaumatin [Rosa chinensis]|uniref:Putative thaumatin n=1 Tax=Rosa chinensis TaxID=74649 RepID=A0A2P6P785_ROSCH|nr:putative thaumatin [Rosa chinensis]